MIDEHFRIGRWENDGQPVRYDPGDLTTHGVLIGMTGSGKTGLLVALLEEAAQKGIPAIVVDPKGDLANLMLHFPELSAKDFAPWVDPETARRQGQTIEELSSATAEKWRTGLSGWGLGRDDLLALRDRVDYTLFTPGSTAGMPVNLLSSFAAPSDWAGSLEANRERIASTVTALLGLVGMTDVDPLRSREHILLANIFESAWSQGRSLDLGALIELVQVPPFEQLGAFPLERFFPEKDRFDLALLLNNFLAAPSFQTWLTGHPLDGKALLYGPGADGQVRPRFSIFYLAHLSENERMFFVTLLLSAVEGWMRAQRGTSGLRALLAFDEIVGYLPPVANPPSRPVLMRLLKQGRAFGLGLLLSTQNPTDLNYKGLSNAGSWFIGRLQTERDRDRLLDGLQSLESAINRSDFERLISGLKPRQFLLHNIHQAGGARVFQSRWALNYLAGPLTRAQLAGLKSADFDLPAAGTSHSRETSRVFAAEAPAAARAQPAAEQAQPAAPAVKAAAPMVSKQQAQPAGAATLSVKPGLPAGTSEFFFPAALSLQRALAALGGAYQGPLEPAGMAYKPALMGQCEVRFQSRRYELDHALRVACLLPEHNGHLDWESFTRPPFDLDHLEDRPDPRARYLPLPAGWDSARGLGVFRKDFLDWVHRSAVLSLPANEALAVYGRPEENAVDFRKRVDKAAGEAAQDELDQIAAGFDSRLSTIARKIQRQQLVVERREDALDHREDEQRANDLDFVAGLFTGRKRKVSTALSKRRMTQQARSVRDEARQVLKDLQAEYKSLEAERQDALTQVQAAWRERAREIGQVTVTPYKKDVLLELFGVAWLPYYLVQSPGGVIEAPAF